MRRTVTAAWLLGCLVASAVVSPALAATRPNVSVTATPSGTSVSVSVAVNRAAKQIATCTYRVDTGAATSCGAKSSVGSKSTGYSVGLTGQAPGDHTLSVTVTLTDGGGGTGSDDYTILGHATLVRAWADFPGGTTGVFEPTDTLLNELIDSNDSGTVNAGDTVAVYLFPLDFNAVPIYATTSSPTHTVASVVTLTATRVTVQSTAGNYFTWDREFPREVYAEASDADFSINRSILFDRHLNETTANSFQDVIIVGSSPSGPSAGAELSKQYDGDDVWLQVSLPPAP